MMLKKCGVETKRKGGRSRVPTLSAPQLHISDYFTLVEREAGHVAVWTCPHF